MIEETEARPDDIDCVANARRALSLLFAENEGVPQADPATLFTVPSRKRVSNGSFGARLLPARATENRAQSRQPSEPERTAA